MSNTLNEYQLELRGWADTELAYALDHLTDKQTGTRLPLYTSVQKKDIRDEAARRLRWGGKAEENNYHLYKVMVEFEVEATNDDEAQDSVTEALDFAASDNGTPEFRYKVADVTLEDLSP